METLKDILNNTFRANNRKNLESKHLKLKRDIIRSCYLNNTVTIPELKKQFDISIPTLTKLIKTLLDQSILSKSGEKESTGGRKAMSFSLNPKSFHVLGIQVGLTNLRLALFNVHGKLATDYETTAINLKIGINVLDTICTRAIAYISQADINSDSIIAAGVAIPGLTNAPHGESYSYFKGINISKYIEEKLKIPAYIENDARIMALGEAYFGVTKQAVNSIFINMGDGIGTGMLLNKRLYRGSNGLAGELGHILMEENGKLCYCGKKGCLETLCSTSAILENARIELKNKQASLMDKLCKSKTGNLTDQDFITALKSDDVLAIQLLSDAAKILGKGLATLMHILNPDVIVIGGKYTFAGNYLKNSIEQSLNLYGISKIREKTIVCISGLGNDACIIGTYALVIESVFIS